VVKKTRATWGACFFKRLQVEYFLSLTPRFLRFESSSLTLRLGGGLKDKILWKLSLGNYLKLVVILAIK
jgi:hypothetical protein